MKCLTLLFSFTLLSYCFSQEENIKPSGGDSTFNANGQLEHFSFTLDGYTFAEEAYSYWENGQIKEGIYGTPEGIDVLRFDPLGNLVEYQKMSQGTHLFEHSFRKYSFRDDSIVSVIFSYGHFGNLTEVQRVYTNEPGVNDHTETYDQDFRIIHSVGPRPLSQGNPNEEVLLNYIYSTEDEKLAAIQLCNPNGSPIRTATFRLNAIDELVMTEFKRKGKKVNETSDPQNFYIKEYYRALKVNLEMDSIYKFHFEGKNPTTSEIILQADTVFNDRGLPSKIVTYNLFGREIMTETMNYHPSDTIYEQVSQTPEGNEKQFQRYDEMGNLVDVEISENEILHIKMHFDNEYDSLNRLIICHEYDSTNSLQNVHLFEYDKTDQIVKEEVLNPEYKLEEYSIYTGKKHPYLGFDLTETFDTLDRMIKTTKDVQISWNSQPVTSHLEYHYNDQNVLDKITVFEMSLESHNYYEIIYKTVNRDKLVGIYVSIDYNFAVNKEEELQIHPLANEFHYVMQRNAENKTND